MTGVQAAAVGGDDIHTDCQPKTGSTAGSVAGALGAIKTLAEPRQLLVANAGAAIGEIERQHATILFGVNLQAAALSV